MIRQSHQSLPLRTAPGWPAFGGKPQPPVTRVQFGGAETAAAQKLTPKIGNVLKYLDFKTIGASHVNQIQIIYASCIAWRLLAANERRKASPSKSWNEIRESAMRDSVGYAFWFFGTPIIQRLYLGAMAPKNIRNSLILATKADPNDKSSKLWRWIKQYNPITGQSIPTSEQVKDLRAQALLDLKNANISEASNEFHKVEQQYSNLLKHRNLATGIGLLSTIALLGIGINYLNFYLTQRNVKQRQMAEMKPTFPNAPTLPSLPAPQQMSIPQLQITQPPALGSPIKPIQA